MEIGTVIVQSGDNGGLKVGDRVHLNQIISTGKYSFVAIEFDNNERISIGADSETILDTEVYPIDVDILENLSTLSPDEFVNIINQLEASASGGNKNGDYIIDDSDSISNPVYIDRTGNVGDVTAGYETNSVLRNLIEEYNFDGNFSIDNNGDIDDDNNVRVVEPNVNIEPENTEDISRPKVPDDEPRVPPHEEPDQEETEIPPIEEPEDHPEDEDEDDQDHPENEDEHDHEDEDDPEEPEDEDDPEEPEDEHDHEDEDEDDQDDHEDEHEHEDEDDHEDEHEHDDHEDEDDDHEDEHEDEEDCDEKGENNGWGNGDQDAPGNSGGHNQAENSNNDKPKGILKKEDLLDGDDDLFNENHKDDCGEDINVTYKSSYEFIDFDDGC